jgi:hypothetical protein
MAQYSANFKKATNPVSTGEQSLILLTINQAALETPIYVVNDKADVVSNGITFQAFAFQITLPSDPMTGDPTATLTIDNIGQDLMQWLEISNGAPGATVTIESILRSAPNNVEWSCTLNLINISCTASIVSGTLSYTNLSQQLATNRTYSVQLAPGLYG